MLPRAHDAYFVDEYSINNNHLTRVVVSQRVFEKSLKPTINQKWSERYLRFCHVLVVT